MRPRPTAPRRSASPRLPDCCRHRLRWLPRCRCCTTGRTKDLLLAPAGARVVTELARTELGHYRLYRRVKFKAHLSEERLSTVLESLCGAIAGHEQQTPAAHS